MHVWATVGSARRRWIAVLVAALVVGLALAGCGAGAPEQTGGGSGEEPESPPGGASPGEAPAPFDLRIGLNAFPPQLDPHLSSAAVDRQVFQSLYDKLVDVDENLNIVPELAESWEISDDGTVYTLHLRQGVTFHDGTPFNAEAVKFNFERMQDEALGSPRLSEIALVTGVEVVDEYTVRITLEKPFSPFLSILADRAGMMVSPTAAQQSGADFSLHPVGTGEYQFESMTQGDQIVLKRYDGYWRQGAYAERVIFKAVTDENVKVAQLQAGELDIIDSIPAPQLQALQADTRLHVSVVPGLGWQGMWLNTTAPPLDNKLVRQAIAAAVDRATLTRVVFGDTAVPGVTPFPPGYPVHDESLTVPPADVERARALLEQAGVGDVSFTLKIAPSPINQRAAEVVQDMLGEAGIAVQIEQVEFGTLLEQTDAHNYQAALLGWSGRPDPDQNIYSFFHSEGGLNLAAYANPEVDRLLEEARAARDWDERKQLYADIMAILLDDVPYVFIYHPLDIKAMRNDLTGFVHVPDGMIRTLGVRVGE